MIRLAKLDRVETKLRNELAAKRQEYAQKAQPESLAAEFGITYDKACELLLHWDNEQVIRQAETALGMKRQRIKYVSRDSMNGLLVESAAKPLTGFNAFDLENFCDADD